MDGWPNTGFTDWYFERGIAHTLTPEDAFLSLDAQDVQEIASAVEVGSEERIEVPNRYGFTATTFTPQLDGNYVFNYGRGDNTDTYSQFPLFALSDGATEYMPVEIGGSIGVSTGYVPSFDPYNENGHFGNLTWKVDENPEDGSPDSRIALVANTEYLLVVDSWIHVLTDGSRQLNAAAYDITITKDE